MHTAGERVFVDFAGHTMEVIDGATGEIQRVEVFVAVLGASSYVFAQATWTQSLPDWIAAHVNMLASIGGVPRQIVSDNLRAGITRACTSDSKAAKPAGWLPAGCFFRWGTPSASMVNSELAGKPASTSAASTVSCDFNWATNSFPVRGIPRASQ